MRIFPCLLSAPRLVVETMQHSFTGLRNLSGTSSERGRHGRAGGGALDRLAGLMRAGGGAAANGRLQTCLSIHVQTWFQGDEVRAAHFLAIVFCDSWSH